MAGAEHEVVIEAIGARGDGVARLGGTRVFVPFTLPGDRLRVRIAGRRGDGLVGEPVE
jgi:23S rRNA (uracil1939-C5)-methyltransferase